MENNSHPLVWPKTKEEIWEEVFEPLEEKKGVHRCLHQIPAWGYAATLLLAALLAGCFYTVTDATNRGEQAEVRLPDRSKVTLNAESHLSYKPFLWFFSRKVHLAGEAFFEVKSGSRFSVQSGESQTMALGTTFNVYARRGSYRVTCLTGQVRVVSGSESITLNANMQAALHEPKWRVSSGIHASSAAGWMQGKFEFVETPLKEVIAEVERQYNIHVTPSAFPDHLYTGNFSTSEKIEDILAIIGNPFGISFSVKK